MYHKRKSGVLLHPTSLPGPGGIGSLGDSARAFVDFLHASGQSLWQILPTGPTGHGNSPYACYSAFAGNPLLIDLQLLVEEGDLGTLELHYDLPDGRVDFGLVEKYKLKVLKKAAANFFAEHGSSRREEFDIFCNSTWWLDDFALFMALKGYYNGRSWSEWPEPVARREPAVLNELSRELAIAVDMHKYLQWQFFRQWHNIREYANRLGVGIVGDIPIFLNYDSADVWATPHLFCLDERGRPTAVAGVPPDYFSETGQLWGNPLYNWQAVAGEGYKWWIDRFRTSFYLFDMVRLDHFRGFAAHWEVPAGEKTAINGSWVRGPGAALFHAVEAALGSMPIIAEDLGVITPDVESLRDSFSFPGMKILQFAFGSGPQNPYLPHNHIPGSVIYTGTHDNDTTVGWFNSLSDRERNIVCRYLHTRGEDISWDLIRTALVSVAETAIIPLQDILSLGSESRMNTPGTASCNWTWRFPARALTPELAARLLELTEMYGRRQSPV